jgi:hypothetical protein
MLLIAIKNYQIFQHHKGVYKVWRCRDVCLNLLFFFHYYSVDDFKQILIDYDVAGRRHYMAYLLVETFLLAPVRTFFF